MGLFGALYAGVSGLDSQSNKIGIISNNISNVNTVGFKQGQAAFDTLVVPSGTQGTFSPGGVLGNNQQLVNQQGLIQGTSSPTDVAISGGGMFVVDTNAAGASSNTGQVLFTRSGSFTQDSLGNFINSNKMYLQGWPLDANGNPPADKANFTSLRTVNIESNASGAATATSNITLAANFNSSQTALLGGGVKLVPDVNSANNTGITASEIIAGNEDGGGSPNGIVRGDSFTAINGGGSTKSTYVYGGYTIGRDVTSSAAAGDGDAGGTLNTETVAGGLTTNGTTDNVSVTVGNGNNYPVGSYISISGVTGNIGGQAASNFNGDWKVISSSPTNVTFQIADATVPGAQSAGGGAAITVTNRSYPFTGNMLDATNTSSLFLGQSGTANFTNNALNFSIASNGTVNTYKYVSSAPDVTQGQFNSLATLSNAINDTSGLTSRVVSNRLYVSSTDANQGLTFTNGDATGNGAGLSGVNWVQELGLGTVPTNTSPTTHVFNTMNGLSALVNTVDPSLTSTVNNPQGSSTVSINEANSQQTVEFTDTTSNHGSLLAEFGFKGPGGAQLQPNTGFPATFNTGVFPNTYVASDPKINMSSGAVTPQFSRDITVYDSLGNSHVVAFNVSKLSTNSWAVELTAVPKTDVSATTNVDGQLASGIVSFNGDGSLASVSASLQNPITIPWTNGSNASNISLNLGTFGKADGLSQYSSAFNVSLANQNGSSVGELTGVSIDTSGYVIASFSNGQTQKVYQVPLASVNNPDGLTGVSGDAYEQTQASGVANLEVAGTNGTGSLSASSLEQSNVDLSSQLTNLIVAQQAYGANTRVLTISDQLLQQLDQIIQ